MLGRRRRGIPGCARAPRSPKRARSSSSCGCGSSRQSTSPKRCGAKPGPQGAARGWRAWMRRCGAGRASARWRYAVRGPAPPHVLPTPTLWPLAPPRAPAAPSPVQRSAEENARMLTGRLQELHADLRELGSTLQTTSSEAAAARAAGVGAERRCSARARARTPMRGRWVRPCARGARSAALAASSRVRLASHLTPGPSPVAAPRLAARAELCAPSCSAGPTCAASSRTSSRPGAGRPRGARGGPRVPSGTMAATAGSLRGPPREQRCQGGRRKGLRPTRSCEPVETGLFVSSSASINVRVVLVSSGVSGAARCLRDGGR